MITDPAPRGAFARALRALPILPVLRSASRRRAVDDVRRLRDSGVSVVELTTSIPDWAAALEEARADMPDLIIGVGTVTGKESCQAALAAGAAFIVSPWPVPEVRIACSAAAIPFVEGGFSPGEIASAAQHGPAKLFPAHVGGPAYLRSLLAVIPHASIIPTGGVLLSEVESYLSAGAMAVGVGSALFEDPDLSGRLAGIAEFAAGAARE